MLTILGDILDFSKIDHNSMVLESAPVTSQIPHISPCFCLTLRHASTPPPRCLALLLLVLSCLLFGKGLRLLLSHVAVGV